MSDHARLGGALNAAIPRDWPPEGVRDVLDVFARDLDQRPSIDGWRGYYWVSTAEPGRARLLVGSGGFKGVPDSAGVVELGCGVLPAFQNKGYATEAVQALVQWALAQAEVTGVMAEVSPSNVASVRVLEKCGFVPAGSGSEPEVVRYRYLSQTGAGEGAQPREAKVRAQDP